jgi:hypothetical protein
VIHSQLVVDQPKASEPRIRDVASTTPQTIKPTGSIGTQITPSPELGLTPSTKTTPSADSVGASSNPKSTESPKSTPPSPWSPRLCSTSEALFGGDLA